MMAAKTYEAIPAWVNSNYESARIQRRRQELLDAQIERAYAEDYGDPMTIGEIIKAGLGAAAFLGSFGFVYIMIS
ncbi:hypothetical protein AT798_04655 [Megasphaera sp. DJF_B143]|mgnify:FL=1|nr:hypothetical protein ACT01_11520 [Megasphaera hexanoica]KUH55872.1 hypothetical protein AT798_04655 [Megasphaera sp. DJF_B143]